MRKLRSAIRKTNLLWCLQLLDEHVRQSAIGESYVGSATQQVVAEAIRRAKRRKLRQIQPLENQRSIRELISC